jgi:hypothetical protein
MNIKQRKKEISEKLDYLGYSQRQIKTALKVNYNFKKILNREYLDFEERVNNYYSFVKNNEKFGKIKNLERTFTS